MTEKERRGLDALLSKPTKPRSAKAWDEGAAARNEGKAQEACPYTHDQAPQRRAWLQGWESVGVSVSVQQPRVVNNTPRIESRPNRIPGVHYVHEGEDLVVEYRKPRPVPCPHCRTILLSTMSQACIVVTIFHGVAYMRCRECGNNFKCPAV